MKRFSLFLVLLAYMLTISSGLLAQDDKPRKQKRSRTIVERREVKGHSDHAEDHQAHEHEHEIPVKELEERLEAWAERHARSWEKWAERFENRMEQWAEETEEEMEDWADQYAEKWDKWARDIEEGMDEKALGKLMKNNLKMLSEIPLGSLTERLGDLGDEMEKMPLESLGELNELVAGSIERSIQEMERAIQLDPDANHSQMHLIESLRELEGAMNLKKQRQSKSAQDKLKQMHELIRQKKDNFGRKELELLMAERAYAQAEQAKQMERNRAVASHAFEAMTAKREALLKALSALEEQMAVMNASDEPIADLKRHAVQLKSHLADLEAAQQKMRTERDVLELKLNPDLAELKKAEAYAREKAYAREQESYDKRDRKQLGKDSKQLLRAREEVANEARVLQEKAKAAQKEALKTRQVAEKQAIEAKQAAQEMFNALREKSRRIAAKESEIEQMRAEIEQLRQELNRVRKKKKDDDR